jgi:hypothetical protein
MTTIANVYLRCLKITEEKIDLKEKFQQVNSAFNELRDFFINHFKGSTVEFRDWRLGLGKAGEEHIVEINLKLAIKKKDKKQS